MRVNYKNILNFVSEEQIKNNKAKTIEAYNTLVNKALTGNRLWKKFGLKCMKHIMGIQKKSF